MGANFDSVTFKPCSKEELKQQFEVVQNEMCAEHGHDTYAGHIGIAAGLTISSKTFKNQNDAYDWVSENAEKWENAVAVQVGDFSNVFPKTESEKKLAQTFNQLDQSLKNWDKDIVTRVKSGKSQQRTCQTCASKVSVAYIKTNYCPVCGNTHFLQTDTDEKKLATLKAKFKDVQTKVNEAKKKYNEKNKNNFWFVGAWCAS